MTRLLITGGSGFLGQRLVDLAAVDHTLCHTWFTRPPAQRTGAVPLDLRDAAALARLLDAWLPEVVIHLAGSDRSADMARLIVDGAGHLAMATAARGIRLLHLSTDLVFDGRAAPYAEDAAPTPLSAYGRAKAEAEQRVAGHPDAVIVRTSLLYEPGRLDHATAWLIGALERGEPVTLFTDQFRNPLDATSLSRALLELAALPYRGVLHLAGAQRLSRADYGLRMLDRLGHRDRASLGFGPTRPGLSLDTTLDTRRARALLRSPLPGVDEVLAG